MQDCICHVNLPFESTLESLKKKEVSLTLSMQAPKDNKINQIKTNNKNRGKTLIRKMLHMHVLFLLHYTCALLHVDNLNDLKNLLTSNKAPTLFCTHVYFMKRAVCWSLICITNNNQQRCV